jgi:hypothetical protein
MKVQNSLKKNLDHHYLMNKNHSKIIFLRMIMLVIIKHSNPIIIETQLYFKIK